MKIASLLAAGMLVGTVLAACGDPEPGSGGSIAGTVWVLTGGTLDGTTITPIVASPATIEFAADGTVGGEAACNAYGGSYIVDGSDLSFPEPLFQTEMACMDDGVMELEATFLGALSRITGFTAGADTLILTGDGAELRFEPEPPTPDAALIGTMWLLETLVRGETASTPIADATIAFAADGTVDGITGCNSFSGSYDPDTGFGPLMSSLMACDEPRTDQEQFVYSILVPGASVSIDGSMLTIADLEGNALLYRAIEDL
jgi:heat shock protein HslJ